MCCFCCCILVVFMIDQDYQKFSWITLLFNRKKFQKEFRPIENLLIQKNPLFKLSEKCWVQKHWSPKNVGSKTLLGQKKVWWKQNVGPKRILVRSLRPPNNWIQKIWSITTEIFLIWTNVVRTNVAWTNVTVTIIIICSKWSQEPTLYVWSKLGK